MKDERRSIPLPPELWRRLDELAEETSSLAKAGKRFGKPSWRTMLRRIAEGEIVLLEKSQSGGLVQETECGGICREDIGLESDRRLTVFRDAIAATESN